MHKTQLQQQNSYKKPEGVLDLEPAFVSHGVQDGAIVCVLAVDNPYSSDDQEDESLLLAGTERGDIFLYDLITHKYMGAIYKLSQRRGEKKRHDAEARLDWNLDEENLELYRQGGIIQMGSLSTTSIWVQFRGGCLALFAWDLAVENKEPRLVLKRRIPFAHAGFCRAIYASEKFVLPDTLPGAMTGFSVLDERCNKKIYELSEEILRRDCQVKRQEVDRLKPFAGSIAYLKQYHEGAEDHFFIGFEDASLMLYDAFDSTVVNWYQYYVPERESALLAITSRDLRNSDDMMAHQFLIALPNLVYLLYFDPREHNFVLNKTIKEWKGDMHCTALTFGPESHKRRTSGLTEAVRFALAFSWGHLDVYSLQFDPDTNNFEYQHLYQASVPKDGVLDLNWSLRTETLVACCVELKRETRNKLGKLFYYERADRPKKKVIKY